MSDTTGSVLSSAGASVSDAQVVDRGERVPEYLIPPLPKLTLREVVAGPAVTADGDVIVRTGWVASTQRIIAGTVGLLVVVGVLVGVSVGVWSLLESLDRVGGNQTQDLLLVGAWGLVVLLTGRPRLAKPGKRSKDPGSLGVVYWVLISPVAGLLLTVAGAMAVTEVFAPATLAVLGLSVAVIAWRLRQCVSAIRARRAFFVDRASASGETRTVSDERVPAAA